MYSKYNRESSVREGGPHITTRPSAFTLVELLVVIAIIGILMALLFPAITSVMRKANKTQCLSNCRQISLAASALFADWDPKMPYREAWGDWGAGARQLMPYMGNDPAIFDCPANPGNTGEDYKIIETNGATYYTDYEFNGYLCAWNDTGPDEKGRKRKQYDIVDPTIAAYGFDNPYYPPDSPNRAHKGGINVGYLDGHAAWLADEDMHAVPESCQTFYIKGHNFNTDLHCY